MILFKQVNKSPRASFGEFYRNIVNSLTLNKSPEVPFGKNYRNLINSLT